MTSNMIVSDKRTCYYCNVVYFLLNTLSLSKTALYEFTRLVVYLLPFNCHKLSLTENTNKAFMIMGRNLSLNHIKRHFKSVYFIKYISSIFISSLLAHLSQRLMGELIVYQSLRCPSVCQSVSIFKHLLL